MKPLHLLLRLFYLLRMCVHMPQLCVEVGEQLMGESVFSFYHVDHGKETQLVLHRLAGPSLAF